MSKGFCTACGKPLKEVQKVNSYDERTGKENTWRFSLICPGAHAYGNQAIYSFIGDESFLYLNLSLEHYKIAVAMNSIVPLHVKEIGDEIIFDIRRTEKEKMQQYSELYGYKEKEHE